MEENYFSDLSISNVADMVFPGDHVHELRTFSSDLFSLEMIAEGEVILHQEEGEILLRAPVVFCTGGENSFYYFKSTVQKSPYRHLWIDFSGERGKRIRDSFRKMFPAGFIELTPGVAEAVLPLFAAIKEQYERSGLFSSSFLVVKMEELIYFILAGQEEKGRGKEKDEFSLHKLCEMIELAPFRNYDVNMLARSRNISPVYLRKLFRRLFGISIGKYILQKQMERSALLLLSGEYRIGELAEKCAFSSVSAFSRAFRNTFGCSPASFRKKTEQ